MPEDPAFGVSSCPFDIHGKHHTLTPVGPGHFAQQFRTGKGGTTDRNLVGPSIHRLPHILRGTYTAPHAEGDKNFGGYMPYHIKKRGPAFMGSPDVKKGKLVGAVVIVTPRQLHRIPRVLDALELNPLHYPAVVNVKAGNYPFSLHNCLPPSFPKV